MIGGLLSLGAALVGALLLWLQIRQVRQLADSELDRKRRAARCLLPLHISSTMDYCERVVCALSPLVGQRQRSGWSLDIGADLSLPAPDIEHFSKTIELSGEKQLIEILATILSELQVLNARISGIRASDCVVLPGTPSNLEIYMLQAGGIAALAGSLLPYGRQECESVKLTVGWREVTSCLASWSVDDDSFPVLFRFIERKAVQSPNYFPFSGAAA